MKKTAEEKYGAYYDYIKDFYNKNKDPFILMLMCKIYKSRVLDFAASRKKLKKPPRFFVAGKLQKERVRQFVKDCKKIKGLETPTISAFLHFYTDGKLPIIDKYSYAFYLKSKKRKTTKQIQKEVGSKTIRKFKAEEYMEFYKFYEKKYKKKEPRTTNFELMDEGEEILDKSKK